MFFDTHAHLNDSKFGNDIDKIVSRANEANVKYIVVNGYDIESSKSAIEFSEKYESVYATVGIHPGDVHKFNESSINELREMAKHKKVLAIGEIGLDYYYTTDNKALQMKVFKEQLALAKELDMPITVHIRDAMQDVFDILKNSGNKGIIHCYSGSYEMAKLFIDLGYYISVAGAVTFKNAKNIKEVVEGISLDHLVIETDAPYITPEPFRGKRNEPSYVVYTARKIAELKNVSEEEVANITTRNAFLAYEMGE